MVDESFRQQINPIKIFGLDGTRPYASRVAGHLDLELTPHEEGVYPDGEPFMRSSGGPVGNVRGHDCFVIHSLYSDKTQSVSDKFVNLSLMCGALQNSKAHEVIGVIPYVAWNRQGRKAASRDCVATAVIHSMLVASGMDQALFIVPHDLPATQNSFPVRNFPDTLDCRKLFTDWAVRELRQASGLGEGDPAHGNLSKRVVVLSPDAGAYVRCVEFADYLAWQLGYPEDEEIEVAVLPKTRKKGKISKRKAKITGDVSDAWVISYDDMIATFGTSKRAHDQVVAEGGTMFAITAPHGIFAGDANEQMRQISSDVRIAVSDTIDPWRLEPENRRRVQIVDTTALVADAIRRIHSKTGSISQLLT